MMSIMYIVNGHQTGNDMRVSRAQMEAHRGRIVESAARTFRERGFDGGSVADVMNDAGLTHGGFYGHFTSKEELEAEACVAALSVGAARWSRLADEAPDSALGKIVDAYVSARHRDDPGTGCIFAALGGETARASGGVRRAFTDGLRERLATLTRVVKGRTEARRRQRAIATLCGMVGAIVLARAVDDKALSTEILGVGRAAYRGDG